MNVVFYNAIKPVAVSLLLPLLLSACAAPQAKKNPVVTVEVLRLENEKLPETSEYLALIDSRESVMLNPRVSGQVAQILVHPGDAVRAGQPLLKIDAREQQAELDNRLAAADMARAQILESEAVLAEARSQKEINVSQVDLENKQMARYQNLYNVESASLQKVQETTNSLNQAVAALSVADHKIDASRYNLAAARQKLQETRADIRQRQANLSFYTINAPFSGYVTNIPVKVGDYVNPSVQLTGVANRKEMELVVQIPAEQVRRVKIGTQIQILDEDTRSPIGKTSVYFISDSVNSESQSVLLRGKLKGDVVNKIRADQAVRAVIVWNEFTGLKIPTQSVFNLSGQNFVYRVVKSNGSEIAEQVPVTLGDIIDTHYILQKGLKPGDLLVVSGTQKVKNQAPVKSRMLAEK